MPILYDAIVAFLCCAGIAVTFWALFQPRVHKDTHVAGVIISDDASDIAGSAVALSAVFKEVIVVTNVDVKGVVPENVMVFSPEEFDLYVRGNDKN
ncbi:MAG: hypothetical protein IKU84_06060 [Clostridia bacterium]|nr:hypothetical protein [Clostridia bacterium]